MTRKELSTLVSRLNIEFAQRKQLGGYSTDAGVLTDLTHACLLMAMHLVDVDKTIAKLKRPALRSKKKK